MQILLFILLGIVALFLILLIITTFMSRYERIERSILIKKEKEEIYPYLASLEKFTIWSPWSKKDPNMKAEFHGTPMNVGSSYTWSGNKSVKTGSMTTLELRENEYVKHELVFGNQNKAFADFKIEPMNETCKVTWSLDCDFGSFPLARLMAPLMQKFVGKDFEDGLAELKKVLEITHSS
ncbi:MAG: SRPBCC family protein [Bacteroidota bacterium]